VARRRPNQLKIEARMIILKILLIVGGLLVLGTMIYDKFTGRRATRRVVWPLAIGGALVFVGIVVKTYVM
jgi:hypothetical protein